MAEPFKNRLGVAAVRSLADAIVAVHPTFARDTFVDQAVTGLEALELKARVAHVAATLRPHLPEDWPAALRILVDALPPALPDASELTSGFRLWPVLHLVETAGLSHPEVSLAALAALTKRFSAEFAIRPYLLRYPGLTWERVNRWVDDSDVHVRRLCSEGTRPRLPWGQRLTDAVADPSRGLAVLERLVDDPELYVRRSVANHLNDISKDHPERAVEVARRWLQHPTDDRAWVVRHGLRTLVKRGDPAALEVLGFGPVEGTVDALTITPDPVAIGGSAELSATLTARATQGWLLDWVVSSPRADGNPSVRVVKGTTRQVRAGQTLTLRKQLSLKPVTTRVTRPGTWEVAVQVNGRILGRATLEVTGEPA